MIPGTPHYPEEGSMLMGLPIRWFTADRALYRCHSGHVRPCTVIPDGRAPECQVVVDGVVCGAEIEITFPEDHEPLDDD